MLFVYSYNSPTNEYIGREIAQEDPLSPGRYLDPAKSTRIAPPVLEKNQVAVFETDKWAVYPDYRGQTKINVITKEVSVVDKIGEIGDEYQIISQEMAEDVIIHPDNYGMIDGIFQDITNTIQWREQNAVKVKAELVEYNYGVKEARAYGGIYVTYQGSQLLFETKTESIVNTTATLGIMPDDSTANWKFYSNNMPVAVPITKQQLGAIAQFGLNMINQCFAVEGEANSKVYAASTKEVNDSAWVELFKTSVKEQMDAIPNTINFENLAE